MAGYDLRHLQAALVRLGLRLQRGGGGGGECRCGVLAGWGCFTLGGLEGVLSGVVMVVVHAPCGGTPR